MFCQRSYVYNVQWIKSTLSVLINDYPVILLQSKNTIVININSYKTNRPWIFLKSLSIQTLKYKVCRMNNANICYQLLYRERHTQMSIALTTSVHFIHGTPFNGVINPNRDMFKTETLKIWRLGFGCWN